MKKTLKLIPALAMLLVSAVLVSTTTYAWFSMNTRVTVNGMTVSTRVSSNLQIAEVNSDANFVNGITQSRTGKLEPVSTVNGTTYYYHATSEHVLGNGNVDDTNWIAYSEGSSAVNSSAGKDKFDKTFNSTYGWSAADNANTAYGYVDYVFYLKATATADGQVLKMTKCNLLYNGAAITETAWRVAVLCQDATKDTSVGGDGSLKTIIAPSGAVYYVADKAVSSTTARDNVSNLGTAAVLSSGIATGDHYFKVVVRLWLEGDDTTCTNTTFATLTNNWTLDLAFELAATSSDAVAIIGSVAP